MISWKDYLCEFLEMIKIPKLRQYEATIKRGRYSYVDVNAKLEIFRELVNRALDTTIVREKLHEFIEQRRALGAAKREEAIEASAKRRKVKEQLKADSGSNCSENGHDLDQDANVSADNNHRIQNGSIRKNRNSKIESSRQKDALDRLDLCAVSSCRYGNLQHIFLYFWVIFVSNLFSKNILTVVSSIQTLLQKCQLKSLILS